MTHLLAQGAPAESAADTDTLRKVVKARIRRLWHRSPEPRVNLRSLTPTFESIPHADYVDILISELAKRDPPRNIAVSGPYGSGKSSILGEVRKRRARSGVVEVALATIEESSTAFSRIRLEPEPSATSAVTDALQKEIVKRLLYSAKSAKLPRSQLNRIHALDWMRVLWISAAGALLLGLLAWVYEFPAPFIRLSEVWVSPPFLVQSGLWDSFAHILDTILVFGALVFVQWAFSHIRIGEVAVGEFKLSREDPNQNYFDQYLDEIVYFFARTKTRVVIFEDLDRFADKGIFLALRELNVLLNNSAAIARPVTFIYAIRDSIFQSKRGAEGEGGVATAATDRAKFFDLIVPIVPFVSTEVSGGLLAEELASMPEASQPDSALIALAGKHFPDMRVLRTISNEYALFYDRLIARGTVKLDRNHLFAVLLYKHAYPKDYERIQFGKSKLDVLFNCIERDVLSRTNGLSQEIATRQNELSTDDTILARAAKAGEGLLALLGVFGASAGRRATIASVSIDGEGAYSPGQISTPDFWRSLDIDPNRNIEVQFTTGTTFRVSRAALNAALPGDLPADRWLAKSPRTQQAEVSRLLSIRQTLQYAPLNERMSDPDFVGPGIDADGTTGEISLLATGQDVLGSGFALSLALSGFLDRNFALYTSVYHGALVSADAQTFRVQNVSQRRSSPLTPLSGADIEEIRAKVGDGFLEEPTALNISIFDEIIDSGDLDKLIDLIAAQDVDGGREFAATYLTGGKKQKSFVGKLAPKADWVLTLIAEEAELSDEVRLRYFGDALAALRRDVEYTVSPAARANLETLTRSSLRGFGDRLKPNSALAVAKLIAGVGAQVPDLSRLNHAGRQAIGEQGAYMMTRKNVAALAGAQGSVGLDSIGRRSPQVLQALLQRLPEYLDMIDLGETRSASIDSGEDLFEFLEVVAGYGPVAVEEVLRRAGSEVTLADLPDAASVSREEMRAAYPALARTGSFAPTSDNVLAYLGVVGAVDEALVDYLTKRPRLSFAADITPVEVDSLARALVQSEVLPAQTILSIAGDLAAVHPLEANRLKIDRLEVSAGLVTANLIADTAASFAGMAAWPWESREAAFGASKNAPSFIGELPLTSDEVELLLTSGRVPLDLKAAVVGTPALVALVYFEDAATALIGIAESQRVELTESQILALLAAGAPDAQVVSYLGRMHGSLLDASIVSVLANLGGDWPVLASASSRWRLYPSSESLDLLLDRLVAMRLVSKTSRARGGKTRVTMRPA